MSFQLPESLAVQLLDRPGNDDAFRDVFAADPRQALAQLGLAPAADMSVAEGIWNWPQVSEPASKRAVLASRDALIRQVTAEKAGYSPVSLEVQAKLPAAA